MQIDFEMPEIDIDIDIDFDAIFADWEAEFAKAFETEPNEQ